jgi:hypothetical protein
MDIEAIAARALAVVALAALSGCATAPPVDLASFLERRATCDHLRGEVPDPPDSQRLREIEQGVAQYCTGTDAQLAQLKARYRDDPDVSKRLAEFEPHIEAN